MADENVVLYLVQNNNVDGVKAAMEAGVTVNVQDQDGLTAAHLAAARGHTEVVKLLVHGGADLQHCDNHTRTVFEIAAAQNQTHLIEEVVKYLQEIEEISAAAEADPQEAVSNVDPNDTFDPASNGDNDNIDENVKFEQYDNVQFEQSDTLDDGNNESVAVAVDDLPEEGGNILVEVPDSDELASPENSTPVDTTPIEDTSDAGVSGVTLDADSTIDLDKEIECEAEEESKHPGIDSEDETSILIRGEDVAASAASVENEESSDTVNSPVQLEDRVANLSLDGYKEDNAHVDSTKRWTEAPEVIDDIGIDTGTQIRDQYGVVDMAECESALGEHDAIKIDGEATASESADDAENEYSQSDEGNEECYEDDYGDYSDHAFDDDMNGDDIEYDDEDDEPPELPADATLSDQLFYAAAYNDTDRLNSILVDAEDLLDLAETNEDGYSALHIAASGDHMAAVKLLLVHGASPRLLTRDTCQTALHVAAENGNIDVAVLLVAQYGVPLGTTDANGRTALHLAAQQGHADLVQVLLERCGSAALLTQLLEAKDKTGKRPHDFAVEEGHENVARALNRISILQRDVKHRSDPRLQQKLYLEYLEYIDSILRDDSLQQLEEVFSNYMDIHYGNIPREPHLLEQQLLSVRVFLAVVALKRKAAGLSPVPEDDTDAIELADAAMQLWSSRREQELAGPIADVAANDWFIGTCILAARAIAEEHEASGVIIPGSPHGSETSIDQVCLRVVNRVKNLELSQEDATRMINELQLLDQVMREIDELPERPPAPEPKTTVSSMIGSSVNSLREFAAEASKGLMSYLGQASQPSTDSAGAIEDQPLAVEETASEAVDDCAPAEPEATPASAPSTDVTADKPLEPPNLEEHQHVVSEEQDFIELLPKAPPVKKFDLTDHTVFVKPVKAQPRMWRKRTSSSERLAASQSNGRDLPHTKRENSTSKSKSNFSRTLPKKAAGMNRFLNKMKQGASKSVQLLHSKAKKTMESVKASGTKKAPQDRSLRGAPTWWKEHDRAKASQRSNINPNRRGDETPGHSKEKERDEAELLTKTLNCGMKEGYGMTMALKQGAIHIALVITDGVAERAGLQPGDHIVEIGGVTLKPQSDMDQVTELLQRGKGLETVVRIRRQVLSPQRGLFPSRKGTYTITLAATGGSCGIAIRRSDSSKEIVVESTSPHSPAQRAGIQDGDVLVCVNGKELSHDDKVEDIQSILDGSEGAVPVVVFPKHGLSGEEVSTSFSFIPDIKDPSVNQQKVAASS